MQSKNSTAFFPVKVLRYFTQRSENLSLLKTASDLRYNQEIISLNKFLNFYKFEIVYTSLLDHHGRGICVTKGRLFTKHQCLRYSKVTDYKNRLKLSISPGYSNSMGKNDKQFLTKTCCLSVSQKLTVR